MTGTGKRVGYARVSTGDQDAALQIDALKKAGCIRVFTEVASGAKDDRPELARCLDHLDPGITSSPDMSQEGLPAANVRESPVQLASMAVSAEAQQCRRRPDIRLAVILIMWFDRNAWIIAESTRA